MPAFARLLSTGAGEAVALRPLSDGEVVWLLSLLAQTVRNAGAALLPHLPLLRSLLCAAEERAGEGGFLPPRAVDRRPCPLQNRQFL